MEEESAEGNRKGLSLQLVFYLKLRLHPGQGLGAAMGNDLAGLEEDGALAGTEGTRGPEEC